MNNLEIIRTGRSLGSGKITKEQKIKNRLKEHLRFVENMVSKGGPEFTEYVLIDKWLDSLAKEHETSLITQKDLLLILKKFGEALSCKTVHGFGYEKPYGYAGDFEIIDKIYNFHVSNEPHLKNWDLYFQQHNAPNAVRNRKAYFIELLRRRGLELKDKSFNVLNVASGPARDLYEYFQTDAPKPQVDCVEHDPKAIEFAQNLCRDFLSHITFHQANAFRFKIEKRYDVIWSAGLFDYFNDKQFCFLLKRLLGFLSPGGELVVGNFSENNPSRNYMEILGDWFLNHRSAEHLIGLAENCGVNRNAIRIGSEPEGVNLFLHITF